MFHNPKHDQHHEMGELVLSQITQTHICLNILNPFNANHKVGLFSRSH